MDFKKISSFFGSVFIKKDGPLLRQKLDLKLVKKVRPNFLPNYRQLRYLWRFLNKEEKILIKAASLVIILSALVWSSVFSLTHITTAPKNGGEYIEAVVGQPKFINPLYSSINAVDADLVSLVYSGLFRYNEDQKLLPDLAAGYTVGSDKKTYDIVLRKDVRWSDGEPFTAEDVLFTFETVQTIDAGSPLYTAFQGIAIEKIDDFSVRFILKEPYAPFVKSLTVGILPEHVWSKFEPTNIKLSKTNLQPIGTGPWVFESLAKDDLGNIQSYVLERNPNYYGTAPYLKTLVFKFFSDYAQAFSVFKTQSAFAISFLPRNLKEKVSQKNDNVYSFEMPQYTALFFNQNQQPILKDESVRLALAQALDKKEILQVALNGEGEIIESPILPQSVGYYPEIKKVEYNLEEANKLLDKKWTKIEPEEYFSLQKEKMMKNRQPEIDALKKNPSSTPEMVSSTLENIEKEIEAVIRSGMSAEQMFYRQDKNKNLLQLVITTGDTDEYSRASEILAKMWRASGIQVSVQKVNSKQLPKEILKERNYQILLYGEIVGDDPDPYPFWHSSQTEYPGLNLSLFVDRNADKMLEEGRALLDSKEREALYKKFQDILAKEIPAIFLYTPSYYFVADKSIQGINLKRVFFAQDRYSGISNWYTKTKWVWK